MNIDKCHFCNGKSIVLKNNYFYNVLCTKCGVKGKNSLTEEEAINVWNNVNDRFSKAKKYAEKHRQ